MVTEQRWGGVQSIEPRLIASIRPFFDTISHPFVSCALEVFRFVARGWPLQGFGSLYIYFGL